MRSTMTYDGFKEIVLHSMTRKWLRRLLNSTNGDVSKAARRAEVDRSTLYRLADRHNVDLDSFRRTP